jgi:DNA mismatch repair protein MutS
MTTYTKEIFVKDYFDIHNHYFKTYGKSTLILMQVGSFHECYNTDTEGPDLFYLGEKIHMAVTQKNKSKPLSTSNPRMMGFPSYMVEDMIDRIVNLSYTVIRIDQTSEPPNPTREVVGIFSASTNLNSKQNKTSNLVCIIFDALKLKTQNPILCIGVSSYDMMTGEGCVYETVSTTYDTMLALDNTIRFFEKNRPTETIYHFSNELQKYVEKNGSINRMSLDDLIKYLGIKENMTTYKLSNIDLISNIKYNSNLLDEIYKSQLENINLHVYNYARLSLVGLLDFAKNHQPMLLTKLTEPTYFDNEETLYLGCKALDQLDVLPYNDKATPGLLCLYDIISNTKTPMGKRFLIDQLCNPLVDSAKLNERYNIIDALLKNNLYELIGKELNNISDIPKLIRKMELNKINPDEISNLYTSLIQISKVFKILDKNKILESNKNTNIHIHIHTSIQEISDYIEKTFDLSYIELLNYNNYKEETYNYMLNNMELNNIAKKIETSNNCMDLLVKTLERYIEEINSKVIKKDGCAITLKFNDREGHYMLITKRRCKILKEKLTQINEIDIGGIKIQVKDLEFTDLPKSNNTKITCSEINKISNNVVSYKIDLAVKIKIAFYKETFNIINVFRETLTTASNIIKNIDFLNSGAITAFKCGYCKPEIIEKENSYFDAQQLRHPIIEVINTDVSYHPHNISLGKDNNGILLYGINSSGKSTLMKSIGLAIILAQIGYYVPATSFIYQPYKNIFTRILGNDNIYRGLSSFMVEMIELMAILKRNNNKTLVIADELAKGTEEKSSNILVAYMLETLSKNNTSFITATHLHSIAELPSVKNINNIKIMHIKVSYNDVKDTLIYDRELSIGQGDKYYGVMVAKYMMKNDDFNKRTKELEMEYDNFHVKKSNYNKDLLMMECHICKCKDHLETHHINFQKDCDEVKVKNKPHIKKNATYNLVILCSKCHDKIDRHDIIVNGWVKTSCSIELDYSKATKENN